MKPLSQMNVIPFIDVMLVLLAVVLTTATFVAQGKIPVALPSATQAEPIPDRESIELTIDSEGLFYLEGHRVTLGQMDERLADFGTQVNMLLRVDETAHFQHFVAVVDLLKARGLENLSIVAKRGPG